MDALRKISYWQLLVYCMFAGLMMGSAVRSIIPQVTLVTAWIFCPGAAAEVKASWYACTAGRPAISDGDFPELPNIFAVIGATTVIYGVAFFVVAGVAKVAVGRGGS